jgi:hypothetical protein
MKLYKKQEGCDESMGSLRWREMIAEFLRKSMKIAHSGMKSGLGGIESTMI